MICVIPESNGGHTISNVVLLLYLSTSFIALGLDSSLSSIYLQGPRLSHHGGGFRQSDPGFSSYILSRVIIVVL
jgi:hypothetical protein